MRSKHAPDRETSDGRQASGEATADGVRAKNKHPPTTHEVQYRKERSAQPRRLFPFKRVFETADDVLNLALYLVGLALRLQLGVTDRLADRLLDGAFDLLRRSDDPVLVHDFLR